MARKEQGMTDLRTAAQQALEAWEHINLYGFVLADYEGPMEQAITALKAALEQPEQEPVAWMYVGLTVTNNMHGPHLVWKPEQMDAMSAEKGVVASPLYTHPPRREWRGLSQEEIDRWTPEIHPVILAVEAELKEKNHE
jgi:hypothetical protein